MSEFKEVWAEFKEKKCYPYVRTAVRTVLIYGIFAFILWATVMQVRVGFTGDVESYFDKWTLPLRLSVELLWSFLILNTVLLTFAMFSRSERISFLENRTGEYNKKEERKKLIRSPYFATEVLTLCILFWIAPCNESVQALFLLLPAEKTPHPALIRLIQTPVLAIPSFFIDLYGHMDARAYWLELPERLSKGSIWKSMDRKKKQSYSYFRMVGRLVIYFVIYVIAGKLLPTVLVMIASVLGLMIFLAASAGVLAAIGLLLSTNYLGALLKRRKFLKKLKKWCLENGYTLDDLNHPYLSVFREFDHYTFSLFAHGQRYYARVITCINRGNYMIFDEKGIFTRIKLFRIPLPRIGGAGRYVQSFDRGTGEDRELFRITSEVNYTFEADGKKLLILNPPAKFVKISHKGSLKDADNGDHVGDYSIYTSNAFLRALDRNAVQ